MRLWLSRNKCFHVQLQQKKIQHGDENEIITKFNYLHVSIVCLAFELRIVIQATMS